MKVNQTAILFCLTSYYSIVISIGTSYQTHITLSSLTHSTHKTFDTQITQELLQALLASKALLNKQMIIF